MPIDPAAAVFVFIVGVFLPFAAWRSSRRMAAAEGGPDRRLAIPRRAVYASTFITQLLGLGLALWVAARVGLPIVGEFRFDPLATLVTAAGLGLLVVTLPWRWRTRTPEQKRRLALFVPTTPGEAALNVTLCLLAGIGEEIVYRGVLMESVQWLVGSWWLAALLCSLAFGVAHAIQGPRAILLVSLLAFWMHATVLWTGSLHLPMAVHTLYDLIAITLIARWARADPDTVPPPVTPIHAPPPAPAA